MSPNRLIRLGAALLGGMVAGCDDGPATAPSGPRSPATWSTMVHAGKAGPMLVELRGTPFGTAPADLAPRVTGWMAEALTQRLFRFTADPAAAAEPHIRTILLFAPERIADETAACAGGAAPPFPDATPETIHLLAVFCSRERPLAAATGWVRRVEGPDDPRFADLVRHATRELYREDQR